MWKIFLRIILAVICITILYQGFHALPFLDHNSMTTSHQETPEESFFDPDGDHFFDVEIA